MERCNFNHFFARRREITYLRKWAPTFSSHRVRVNIPEITSACVACKAGFYGDEEGQRYCKSCPRGKYNDLKGQTSFAACKICNSGRYSADNGGKACSNCSEGQYNDEKGQFSCKDCEAGKFNDEVNQATVTCKVCPRNTYAEWEATRECTECYYDQPFTAFPGATSEKFCTARVMCDKGYGQSYTRKPIFSSWSPYGSERMILSANECQIAIQSFDAEDYIWGGIMSEKNAPAGCFRKNSATQLWYFNVYDCKDQCNLDYNFEVLIPILGCSKCLHNYYSPGNRKRDDGICQKCMPKGLLFVSSWNFSSLRTRQCMPTRLQKYTRLLCFSVSGQHPVLRSIHMSIMSCWKILASGAQKYFMQ